MEGLIALIILLWIGFPLLSYGFYWYEVSTPSCLHGKAVGEREILERLLHRGLGLVALSGLVSSILALPVILLLYPFGLVGKWWNVRKSPSSGTVIFIHGLFHNPSGAIFLKNVLTRRGISFISLCHRPWERSIFDVLGRLEGEAERILAGISRNEPIVIIGHSLGGLLAGLLGRSLSERGFSVKGVISLGSPFLGSRLAAFVRCSLGRALSFGSPEIDKVRDHLVSPSFSAVQLWSPADNMVLPISSLYEAPSGWDRIVAAPLCHTGMLFWPGVIRKIVNTVENWLGL